MNSETIKTLKDLFSNKNWVQLAFLFGSQAKNRAIAESDVDIAIWPADNYKIEDFDQLWREIETITGKNVDLVRLNEAKPTVAWAAMRGIPLLIRDQKFFTDNMLRISSEAEDMQDFTLELWNMRQKRREGAAK